MISELKQVLPAIAENFGLFQTDNKTIHGNQQIVLFLVDGMGYNNLKAALDLNDWGLTLGNSIQSPLPSTTPVSLTALGTGLDSGASGMLGATMWLPEYQQILRPLKWEQSPDPVLVQPADTWFEKISKQVPVFRIGPGKYAESGLTQSALRGGDSVSADSLAEIEESIQACLRSGQESFTYVYYPDLDKIGHVHGTKSAEWNSELLKVVDSIKRISHSLPSGSRMFVTADHGMLDVGTRVWLETYPRLLDSVLRITGEPRFRHVFSKPGQKVKLRIDWQEIEQFAQVFTRAEAISAGIFGNVDSLYEERIGDLVVLAKSDFVLASESVDRRVSNLMGQHGGDSETERLIPLIEMAG
jgi:predicted AlkP superfamily pyrophosphatase or phosphodiesterase